MMKVSLVCFTRMGFETMKKIADFVKRHNCYSVDYIIDENIIGGIIIQIGDVIYDGSVRGRLENIKQAL